MRKRLFRWERKRVIFSSLPHYRLSYSNRLFMCSVSQKMFCFVFVFISVAKLSVCCHWLNEMSDLMWWVGWIIVSSKLGRRLRQLDILTVCQAVWNEIIFLGRRSFSSRHVLRNMRSSYDCYLNTISSKYRGNLSIQFFSSFSLCFRKYLSWIPPVMRSSFSDQLSHCNASCLCCPCQSKFDR